MKNFRLNVEDTVVFMCDIQERLVPAINCGEDMAKKAEIMLKGADTLKVPVVYTVQYPQGLGGTIAPLEAALPENSHYFEKETYSACTPEILAKLKELKAKNIVMMGTETHICIYQTTRDLLAEGFSVFLVEDAVGSRTEANKNNGLRLMEDMGAVTTNTETVLFDFLKKSGTPEFKVISKLIK